MIDNEFNKFGENKKIDELKPFKEIQVSKIGKESVPYATEVHKTSEYGSSKKSHSTKSDKGFIKKLLQNAIESTGTLISGVAASAIVLVASVVMFSNLLLPSPNFELLDIVEGYDSVSYNLYASDLQENVNYYINISNSKESYQYDIVYGENINKIDNLIHNTVYNFVVIGVNEENDTTVEYFSTRFYTITKEPTKYMVTWVVDDVVIENDYVAEGELPIYNGSTPTKESTIEYTYNFIGWDKDVTVATGDVTYTAVFEEVLNEFNASYNLIDEQAAIIYWDNEEYNVVQFNIDFDNSIDSRLSYRIKLYDEETNNNYIYEGTEKVVYINVPKDVWSVYITYELIGTYNGIEKIFEEIQIENPLILNHPFISFSDDLILLDTSIYQAHFYISTDFPNEEVYEFITLNITYDDSITENIVINDILVNDEMIITLAIPSATSNIKIDYSVNMLGNNGHNEKIIKASIEYNLSNNYTLERTVIDINYGSAKFYFNYHFIDDSTTLAVKNLSTNEVTYLDTELNYIEVELDQTSTIADYSYYLSDLSGQALEDEITTSLDLSVDISSATNQYSFSYQNPGEVLITYNDDGTMNLYFNVTFETDDPSIYYSIQYRSDEEVKEIYYTESYAKYENIKLANYYIIYYIYKTINDVEYLIDSIAVSGGIEHIYQYVINDAIIFDNNQIKVSLFDYQYKIDNTSFVITIDGVDYAINPDQITYNTDESCYEIVYTVETEPNEVSMTFLGAIYYHNYDYEYLSQFITIMGNQYTLIKIES